MKKVLLTLLAAAQLFYGIFIPWGVFRVAPPTFIWAKWFFLPAYYVAEMIVSLVLIYGCIKTMKKIFGRDLRKA